MTKKKKITDKSLKKALIEQLKQANRLTEQNLDLINDYIDFFKIKNDLTEDIIERGVTVEYNNGGGQKGYKKNDSIAEKVKVNNQMLNILKHLNIELPKEEDNDVPEL